MMDFDIKRKRSCSGRYTYIPAKVQHMFINPFEKPWKKKNSSDNYNSIFRKPQDICGIILYCKYTEKYAVVQGRYTGKWSFPKGHRKKCETILECAMRELSEETGISRLQHPPSTPIKLAVGRYFIIDINNQIELNPQDNREVINSGWFTVDELRSMCVNIDISLFLKKLLQ